MVYTSQFSLIFLIWISLNFYDTRAQQRTTTCPGNFKDCGYFGCLEVEECPQDCELRPDRDSCNVSFNGFGCRWERDTCIVDIQCLETESNQCSIGCFHCGIFGCFVEGLACPLPCEGYGDAVSCERAAPANGISCRWKDNGCSYFDSLQQIFTTGISPTATVPQPRTAFPRQTLTSSTTTSTEEPTPTESDVSATTLDSSSPKVWGPIVGVVVGVIALVALAFLLFQRRYQAHRRMQAQRLHDTHLSGSRTSLPSVTYARDDLLPAIRRALGLPHRS